MQTPREALDEILGRVPAPSGGEDIPLAESVGRVLRRDVASDLDLPPFEKSAMDGFAVRSGDFGAPATGEARNRGQAAQAPVRTLLIVGESRAGRPFGGPVPPGACVAIYTGAELPADCDAVVMVEHTERPPGQSDGRAEGGEVLIGDVPGPGQHVCHRGEDLTLGAVVLESGTRLRPADLSLLASVGCDPVPVFPRPRVAIITTGDELLPPSARPGPGQIREGNTVQLAARVEAAGASARNLGVVPDDEKTLEEAFRSALEESDVLVTTGGVSMGKYDLVGKTLERLGVEPVFHRVAIKPGKPLWFGMWGEVPVFALPGNPVSCLVGCEVFVRAALAKMGGAGDEEVDPEPRFASWDGPETAPGDRERYLPARLVQARDGGVLVAPVPWNGSADVAGLARARVLAVLPAHDPLRAGQLVRYLTLH